MFKTENYEIEKSHEESKRVESNPNLKKFILKFCQDLPIDSPQILFRLLDKIKSERKKKGNLRGFF